MSDNLKDFQRGSNPGPTSIAVVGAQPEPGEARERRESDRDFRINRAIFFGGFASFAMLYGTQPMLPLLTTEFSITAANASLSVSATTAAMALMLIPASILADRFGRERVMKLSLALAAALALACALVSDYHHLLVLRALLGLAVAGLPAAAMAYLGEEIAPGGQGRAMGLYIAGNAFGGMCGRFLAALVSEWASWRWGLAALGVLGGIAALLFWRTLPTADRFTPQPVRLGPLLRDAGRIAGDAGLRGLFVVAFLLTGCFVGLYNYLGFRLIAPPYGLSQTAIGAIFLLYVVGSASSAWTGRLTDRLGRRNVLWIMIATCGAGLAATLADALPAIIAGVAVFTFGFFGAHTAASGWVSRRASERRALAAALYLSSYYLGGSILGSLAGLAWNHAAWPGVVAALGSIVAVVLAVALYLRRVPARAVSADGAFAADACKSG